jgi:hypothetical protein
MAFNCHCRDCQRATGGAYVPAVVVPRGAVKVTGEVRYFGVRGESGQILNRGFCPNCGSRLGIIEEHLYCIDVNAGVRRGLRLPQRHLQILRIVKLLSVSLNSASE